MTHHYRVFPKALTVAECQAVCKAATAVPIKSGDIGFGGKTVVNQNIRKSDVGWLPRTDPALQWLWNKIEFYTHKANFENFDVIDIQNFLDVQFTTYRGAEQGHYGWHQDSTAIVADNRQWDRKLSVCIQLSNPATDPIQEALQKKRFTWTGKAPEEPSVTRYEGGEFDVNPSQPFHVKEFKDAGDLIVFPSTLWHQVRPVTAGVRHSLVTWWNGPRWR